MPAKTLETSLHELQTKIHDLTFRLERVEARQVDQGLSELTGMLRRRGLDIFRFNPQNHLLFPLFRMEEAQSRFYELFKKYSFRLFLREVLNQRGPFRVTDVARYSSPEIGRKYLHALAELGLAESLGGLNYRLPDPIPTSLGPTLEWFLAEVFRKEFSCPALYGLRCKGTRCGGDFDVVSAMESRLIYMEVKSSPPKNIEGGEVHEFFGRLEDLQPHLAFFFVDTELRLKDKIVPLFEAERDAAGYPNPADAGRAEKIGDEIFFLKPALYLLGSKRSIAGNLEVCFRHFFASSPGKAFPFWPSQRSAE
ncbi:MAG: hypothetical protein NTV04_01820 [Deltaproteobacteria bacterium]|nr:hypothetical protein [Deltaproteobacteria bacterium]